MKLYALGLSAGLSAIAGALYASAALVVTPADTLGVQMSVKPVLFSVFGGIGTLLGPVIGAAILVPLSEWLTTVFGASLPGLSGLVYGGALLLVITLFPAGIVPVTVRLVRGLRRQALSPALGAEPQAVAETIRESPVACSEKAAAGPVLTVEGVRKSFGGTRVLLGVSFEVRTGEILGVIGPNGAGKTTLFNVINGYLRADGGRVMLRWARCDSGATIPHRPGRAGTNVPDRAGVRHDVGRRERPCGCAGPWRQRHAEAQQAAWAALGEVGLGKVAHRPVDGLTTGEIRRLELARGLVTAGPTGLLLLDEFLGGLTAADGAVLLAALRRYRDRGGSVLAIEHTMRAMAGFVDRFVVLNFGEVIAEGPPASIWANRDVVKAYLGDKWVA